MKYGEWTVTGEVPKELRGKARKMYVTCSCGSKHEVVLYRLVDGRSTRCRKCRPQSQYQGGKGTKLYNSWSGMRDRCRNNPRYIKLTIDPAWDTFKGFSEWAKANGHIEGLTIDRKDNTKGYYPGNCRWVDMGIQADNKKLKKKKNGLPRGVKYSSNGRRFTSYLSNRGKSLYIGTFDTAREAAISYNNKVKELGFTERPLNIIK